MKTKLTQITLMDDIGEVWIKDGEIIAFVHWSDGYFKGTGYDFIIEACDAELEEIDIIVQDEKDLEKVNNSWGDEEKMKKLLPKLLKKYQNKT